MYILIYRENTCLYCFFLYISERNLGRHRDARDAAEKWTQIRDVTNQRYEINGNQSTEQRSIK